MISTGPLHGYRRAGPTGLGAAGLLISCRQLGHRRDPSAPVSRRGYVLTTYPHHRIASAAVPAARRRGGRGAPARRGRGCRRSRAGRRSARAARTARRRSRPARLVEREAELRRPGSSGQRACIGRHSRSPSSTAMPSSRSSRCMSADGRAATCTSVGSGNTLGSQRITPMARQQRWTVSQHGSLETRTGHHARRVVPSGYAGRPRGTGRAP